eukprot:TRINITY_DN7703_c0_g1_i1.p1 TRINITY_DN7703_c0_g1~~TRINITY_DN7703_c0_g1_i1.p1  ORF type:complete len:184 (-),score=30.65 TRINITY_DN7703_c0_g1_i1:289-840(-)
MKKTPNLCFMILILVSIASLSSADKNNYQNINDDEPVYADHLDIFPDDWKPVMQHIPKHVLDAYAAKKRVLMTQNSEVGSIKQHLERVATPGLSEKRAIVNGTCEPDTEIKLSFCTWYNFENNKEGTCCTADQDEDIESIYQEISTVLTEIQDSAVILGSYRQNRCLERIGLLGKYHHNHNYY